MSLVKKLQPGGDITNPTIPKPAIQKKIKLNIDGQEREFDQEDIDSMYSNILGGLDEKHKEYGRQYLEKLNTALQQGNAKINVGGKTALKMEVDPSIGYQQENQLYSELELKKLYPNKADRQSFKERSNVIQGMHKQLGDLIALKYSGIKEAETAKAEEEKKSYLTSSLEGLARHKAYSSSLHGKEGATPEGEKLALQAFAKMNVGQRQGALRKWIGNYASQIYGLDEKNQELANAFKKETGQDLADTKAKLYKYFSTGKFDTSNLGEVSDILRNRLVFNTFFDKDQLARWKSGQFGLISELTAPSVAPETTPAALSTFTGIKDGVQYNQGKPLQGLHGGRYFVQGKIFTGYVSPSISKDQEGPVDYTDVYNESKYGAFVGGKRMDDTEFASYYGRLTPELKKQFAGYENAKMYIHNAPSSYLNLFSVPNEKGSIAPFLRSKGHRYALDLTTLYAKNVMPDSRIVSVYDKDKALRTGTPWAKNISYYRVFKNEHNLLSYEPIKIERNHLGFDYAILSNGRRVPLGLAKDPGVTQEDFKFPGYKNGGEIKKFGLGGAGLVVNESLRKRLKENVKDILAKRASKQATMGDISKVGLSNVFSTDQLSSADKANLIALGADFGGLVAGMMGASVASGGLGLGGTAANLYASGLDADGYSAGDFGRAGLSGLLDLASMVPGVGLGAKMFKITKSIKGMSNVLKYTGMALKTAGYADMSRAIYKLATEGPSNMNIDDMRSAMGGIRMVLGGFKATNRAKTIAPSQEVKSFDIKNKDGKIFTTKLSAEDELKLSQMESSVEKNAFLKSLAKQLHKIDNVDEFGVVLSKSLTPFRSEGSRSWKPLGKTSKPELKSTLEVQNPKLTDEGATGLNWVLKALYTKRLALKDKAYFDSRNKGRSHELAEKEAEKAIENISEEVPVTLTEPVILTLTPEVVTPGNSQLLLSGRVGPRGVGRPVRASNGLIIYVNSPEPPTRPLLNAPNALNYRPLTSREQAWYMMEQMRNTPVESSRRMPYLLTAKARRYGKPVLESGLGTIYSTGKTPLLLAGRVGQRGTPVSQSSGLVFYSSPGLNLVAAGETSANINNYINQIQGYQSPLYKKGGKVIFAQKGRSSFIKGLGLDILGGITKNSLGEIQLEKKQKPLIPPLQESFKKAVEQRNIAARKLVNLRNTVYQEEPKKTSKLGDLSQNTFGLDLARTLAGNIANQLFDLTIVAPQYLNIAESYLAAPSTSLRDAASIASQLYINRRPLTSDAILNLKILMSNLDKANRLKMLGEAEYSNAFEQNRQRNALLAQEFAQLRSTVANQNAEAQADAENKRIQLANTVRGLNAENLLNFATRWITKSELDKLQNKGINTELALNELSNQTSGEQNKMLNRYNYLNSLEAAGQLTPELSNEKNDLEKKYAAYNALTKNISLNIYKNPNYLYNLLEEKKKVGLSKAGGLLQIENKYNLRRVEDINKSLQTKYNLTVKNNLELLKDILKSAKR